VNVLIIGSGGREHALAWKAAQSPKVDKVYVAPGNAGTAREPGVENLAMDPMDFFSLADFASGSSVELAIVGPEGPLVAGLVDEFQDRGVRCVGPSAAAAQLEGSKAFAKDFMTRHGIPTAAHAVFETLEPALAWLHERGAPIVIKADGLAAGKGVVVAATVEEAETALRDMLEGNRFGDAGARVVIEECLEGEEASFMVLADGRNALPLATSQDHKRVGDGDTGPNTGGMGAYSPAPVIDAALHERIMSEIIMPTVHGMAKDGIAYRGFLYAGLMITPAGDPKVIEFNCRLGDPETQPLMLRLRSDLIELCERSLYGDLTGASADWDPRPALAVVLAAGGYPDASETGAAIRGADGATGDDVKLFHAGTAEADGQLVTAGGRVLSVAALGDDIRAAREAAYAAVDTLCWDGITLRRDIGQRALDRYS
jgi:phosphoribosylamine--glycine ligase